MDRHPFRKITFLEEFVMSLKKHQIEHGKQFYGNESSVAPAGAWIYFDLVPTAIAVGYYRAPLRG